MAVVSERALSPAATPQRSEYAAKFYQDGVAAGQARTRAPWGGRGAGRGAH